MEQIDIDTNVRLSEEFLAEAIKWGKHVHQPFSPVVLRDVFLAYQAKIAALIAAHEAATKAADEAHQRYVAELNGRIGGLQKQINKQKD